MGHHKGTPNQTGFDHFTELRDLTRHLEERVITLSLQQTNHNTIEEGIDEIEGSKGKQGRGRYVEKHAKLSAIDGEGKDVVKILYKARLLRFNDDLRFASKKRESHK